jgi:hypothetical protein
MAPVLFMPGAVYLRRLALLGQEVTSASRIIYDKESMRVQLGLGFSGDKIAGCCRYVDTGRLQG